MKNCVSIAYIICVLLNLNLTADSSPDAIHSTKNYNKKVVILCRATQIYCSFENIYWLYKSFFTESSKCDEQYCITRLMINCLASLCIDLHIDNMNKQNEELEKQLRELELEAS